MRDCTTCKHSVQNKPENKGKAIDKLPCATCKPSEPREGHISYGPQFEHPSEHTWRVLTAPKAEYRMETFRYWLDAWTQLEPCDQRIIALIITYPEASQAELARKTGVSRQAVHKKVRRLRKRFPGVFQ